MEVNNWQKTFLLLYASFIFFFYVAIIFEIDPFYSNASTVELTGFIFVIPLLWAGIKKQPSKMKLAWYFFFASTIFFFIGDAAWAYNEDYLGTEPKTPSVCDIFYVTDTALLFVGLLIYLRKMNTINLMAISFDMIISIFAAGGIMYNFMIAPVLKNQPESFFSLFLLTFMPVLDFALMMGILLMIFGTEDRRLMTRQNLFLGCAFFLMFVLDELSLVQTIYETDIDILYEPLWTACCAFLSVASLYPGPNNDLPVTRAFSFTSRSERILIYSRTLIPYFFTFVLLILIGAKYDLLDALFIWAMFLVVMISIRQILVLERNKKLLRTIRTNEAKLHLQNLELQRLNEKILRDAEIDFLTQLSNRRHIDKAFEQLTPPEGRAESLGVLLIDVDFFKRINDTYGHPKGDFVLKAIADKIKSVIRGNDIAGRFGGDEFIVLMPQADISIVNHIAEQLTNSVRKDEQLAELKVTLSIGGTGKKISHENYDVQLLLKQADDALYKAKEGGRNRFVVE